KGYHSRACSSRDGRFFFLAHMITVRCYSLSPTGPKLVRRFKSGVRLASDLGIQHLAASPDGNTVAAVLKDGHVCLWVNDGEGTQQPFAMVGLDETKDSSIHTAAFSPNRGLLITGDSVGQIQIWEVRGKKVKQLKNPVLEKHKSAVMNLAFSSDGS